MILMVVFQKHGFFNALLGVFLNNKASGWFAASTLWALMHYPCHPNYWFIVSIIPFGLFLGYVTYQTKSIVPSVLIHGTNLWSWM
jgi:membrane protease YdiL (CAAX protease family)